MFLRAPRSDEGLMGMVVEEEEWLIWGEKDWGVEGKSSARLGDDENELMNLGALSLHAPQILSGLDVS